MTILFLFLFFDNTLLLENNKMEYTTAKKDADSTCFCAKNQESLSFCTPLDKGELEDADAVQRTQPNSAYATYSSHQIFRHKLENQALVAPKYFRLALA
jgi:hypothetical protein